MKIRFYILIIFLILCFSQTNADSKLNVVVTIKPYHSLVSGVMLDVARPVLLLKGSFSPHRYSLKPSDAKKLQYADIIFWGGKKLEGYLTKPLNSLSKKAKIISMLGISGLKLKYFRPVIHMGKYDIFESNISDNSIYKDYELKSAVDPHIWLDPENAKVITSRIVNILSKLDPVNSEKYKRNGEKINVKIKELDKHIQLEINEISNRNYLVLHDAYQYFESRYQLNSVGSLTIQLNHIFGVRRLKKIQNMINNKEIICIFGEPQYSQKIVETMTKGTSVKKGLLDPIGLDLLPGPELYFDLMKNLTISLKSCLY